MFVAGGGDLMWIYYYQVYVACIKSQGDAERRLFVRSLPANKLEA
jgi:hypothetical protein